MLAVALLLVSSLSSGQDLPAARAFVSGLYSAYQTGKGPNYLSSQAKNVFSPSLLVLIRRDQADAQGEVGALDYDPICGCQDFDISDIQIEVTGYQTTRARARVRFINSGLAQSVVLDLVAIKGQWRISDVHDRNTSSLVHFLKQSARHPVVEK